MFIYLAAVLNLKYADIAMPCGHTVMHALWCMQSVFLLSAWINVGSSQSLRGANLQQSDSFVRV